MNDKRLLAIDVVTTAITKGMVDKGKIVEAGWTIAERTVYKDVPKEQLVLMREAFLAGAQHLFMSIMTMLDPGQEPTALDEERMEKIGDEMMAVYEELKAKYLPHGV